MSGCVILPTMLHSKKFIWCSRINKKCRQSKFTYSGRGGAFDGKIMWIFFIGFPRNVVNFSFDNTLLSDTHSLKKHS